MKRAQILYEFTMVALACTSIALLWSHHPYARMADLIIWAIFVADYTIRLVRAEQKWTFVKSNIFDLIAILPLDAIFRSARFVRLFRLLRLTYILMKYAPTVYHVLRTNGLHRVIAFILLLVCIAAIPIVYIEPNIHTFEDALWWAIVTTTTVGYGDISPETGAGRVIAVILMLFGIGLLGTVTASIASYFIHHEEESKDTEVAFVQQQLSKFEQLKSNEIRTLIHILETKREERQQQEEESV